MNRILAGCGVAVPALLLAGCGGSGSAPGPATSTSPAAAASGPTAPATAPADPAAAKRAIERNWERFFASGTSRSVATGLLEHGDQLGKALQVATREDRATGGKRSADVTKVTFTSATQANVTYTLVAAGQTLPASGVAVYEDGTWKVSVTTFCTLVVLGNGGRPVPGCAS